jgi:hypothetical protein
MFTKTTIFLGIYEKIFRKPTFSLKFQIFKKNQTNFCKTTYLFSRENQNPFSFPSTLNTVSSLTVVFEHAVFILKDYDCMSTLGCRDFYLFSKSNFFKQH